MKKTSVVLLAAFLCFGIVIYAAYSGISGWMRNDKAGPIQDSKDGARSRTLEIYKGAWINTGLYAIRDSYVAVFPEDVQQPYEVQIGDRVFRPGHAPYFWGHISLRSKLDPELETELKKRGMDDFYFGFDQREALVAIRVADDAPSDKMTLTVNVGAPRR